MKHPQLVAALVLSGAAAVAAAWWGWQSSEPPARAGVAPPPAGMTVGDIQRRQVLPDGGANRVDAAGAASPESVRAPVDAVRSGGAMPQPAVDPDIVRAPGQTASDVQMQRQMQHVWRMRRPAGIGPAAFGATPAG